MSRRNKGAKRPAKPIVAEPITAVTGLDLDDLADWVANIVKREVAVVEQRLSATGEDHLAT